MPTTIAEKRPLHMSASRLVLFATELGWMGLDCAPHGIRQLHFGYADPQGLLRRWKQDPISESAWSSTEYRWVNLLKRYACGETVRLDSIPVVVNARTPFQRSVLEACRMIPRGETRTYGALAEQIGYAGAARAVGTVMSRNVLPLLIPCHRVLGRTGLGGYSAPQGLRMKRRLLAMENVAIK